MSILCIGPAPTIEAPVGSLLADAVMEEMGMWNRFGEEFRKLHKAFPALLWRTRDTAKNFENLKLVDFVQELLEQRMQKLMALTKVFLQ